MITRRAARPLPTLLAVLGATIAIALAPVTAGAATRVVEMGFSDFSPSGLTLSRGDEVRWINDSPLDHDVKSTAPAKYFSSGRAGGIGIGEQYSFTFRSAGRFSYHCSVHPGMDGSVTVPLRITTLYGPLRYRITVASSSASSPWKHEIQVQKPGSSSWTRIALTSATSVTYDPSKRGSYDFRTRVTNVNTGADSGWSPTVSRTY